MLSNFQQRDTQTPDVTGDSVALACDALGRHVVAGTDEGVGITFGAKLTTHTEITELDLSLAREKDIGGFNITVDDPATV